MKKIKKILFDLKIIYYLNDFGEEFPVLSLSHIYRSNNLLFNLRLYIIRLYTLLESNIRDRIYYFSMGFNENQV
jgi:hypothetical protein